VVQASLAAALHQGYGRTVEGRGRHMAAAGARKSDAQIQQEVLRELQRDPWVEETEVGVQVANGVVTLTGTVTSGAKRVAAQEAAHRVAGVLDVANDLEVKRAGLLVRTDTEIAQAVRRALERDVSVPDQRIRSTVTDGWVTLEGTVDFGHEREDAERAVRNLASVRGVTNRITAAHATAELPQEAVGHARGVREVEDRLEIDPDT
jgi:osmotically-inducible protein OsmY